MANIATISFIIPVLNDAQLLRRVLVQLSSLVSTHEVIVVDGGSTDETLDIASALADQCLTAPQGRASQMNAGAAAARGEILVFLHADTLFTDEARQAFDAVVNRLLTREMAWGFFAIRLSGRHWMLRCVEQLMNLRSRITSISTGDQMLLVTRSLFTRLGGFPQLALMEDIAMTRLLKQQVAPFYIKAAVVTSSRQWERHGIWRTIVKMWYLRLAYWCGADTHKLAARYYARRLS